MTDYEKAVVIWKRKIESDAELAEPLNGDD